MFIHLVGANLNLNHLAFRADHGGMQGLVVIALGHRDVIIELTWNGLPQGMYQPEHAVTTRQVINQNTHGPDIIKLMKVQAFALHFPVNTVDVLGPAFDLTANGRVRDRRSQFLNEIENKTFPVGSPFRHQRCNTPIFFGLIKPESQVFQFPFELPDAKPVGQRRMNQHDFPGQMTGLLVILVLQPVQLHQLP